VSGTPGVVACKYCGGRVDIPIGGPAPRPPPPIDVDEPRIDADPFRPKSSEGNNAGAAVGIGVAVVFVVAVVGGVVAEKHKKSKSKFDDRGKKSTSIASPQSTPNVWQPPRFEPIARKATVATKRGDLPFRDTDTTCDMRISPLPTSGHCRVWLTCGTTRVYGSSTSWIQCSPATGAPTSLVDPETTPDDGDAQLNVDLVKNTATFGDTNLAGVSYSATFTLQPTTDPPPPAPPAFSNAYYTATVTSRAGTPPFSASSCSIKVSPLPNPDLCRVWVTCNGKRVYGSDSSTTQCEASDQGPALLNDWKPSTKDNDAQLQADFRRGTAVLADTDRSGNTYVVTFKVTK